MFQNIGAGAYKPGLDTIRTLCSAFGDPQQQLRTIHVGGTNGKGSTSSLIASVLTECGLRTGLFTSPHLIDFRERIRIDGLMISEEEVVGFIDRFRAANLTVEPSFFELTTAMAFDRFAASGCDVAVIEAGLGGRLDSTNIITPEASIITNISLDHTALLGDTEEKIAHEKAGIIKEGIPVIIGHAQGPVRHVFEQKAADSRAPIDFAEDSLMYHTVQTSGLRAVYTGTPWGDLSCPLTGACQRENANTVMHALKTLKVTDADAVRRGFENVEANTGLAGRWMTLSESPKVICDTGHNPGGWQWLGRTLEEAAAQCTLHMVIGFVNDKDITSILHMMPRNAEYYFATPSVRRGRPADELRDIAAENGITGTPYPSVEEAYRAALGRAADNDTVFVGGSTFVVADLLSIING